MRSVAQSLLARHPLLAGVGVGYRWGLWLAAGHPFGLIVFGLAIVAGLPWWYRMTVWAGTELALGLWGFAGLTTGAESLYLWGHLCRFRRRWPGEFTRAYHGHGWPPVVVGSLYSVPGGLRPAFAAPRLSLMPRAFDHRTVGWRLLPRPDHDITELALAVGRIGGSDDRVGTISLRSLPGGELALIVRFRRLGTGRSSKLPTGLGSLVIDDETGGSAIDPWDDPVRRPTSPSFASIGAVGDDVVRLGELADAAANETNGDEPLGMIAGPSATSAEVSDRVGGGAASHPAIGSDAGPFVSNLPPRSRFPMKWSFSVILPSNVLMAVAVGASDAGPVGVLAVCAAAVISLILIVAEGVADR